jgi:hypothetical protein
LVVTRCAGRIVWVKLISETSCCGESTACARSESVFDRQTLVTRDRTRECPLLIELGDALDRQLLAGCGLMTHTINQSHDSTHCESLFISADAVRSLPQEEKRRIVETMTKHIVVGDGRSRSISSTRRRLRHPLEAEATVPPALAPLTLVERSWWDWHRNVRVLAPASRRTLALQLSPTPGHFARRP